MHAVNGKSFDRIEQAAVEAEDMLPEDRGEAVRMHGSPQRFNHRLKVLQIIAKAVEEVGKAIGWKEADILGEEGEDAAQ
jgi:hypothetical protein